MTVTAKTRSVPVTRGGSARGATTVLLIAVASIVSGCGGSAVPARRSGQSAGQTASASTASSAARSAAHAAVRRAPKTKLAFSRNGHTSNGDAVHLEGRWGPLETPSESDVDQIAFKSCPETDGRELIRRLDITIVITSGLPGEVRMTAPVVAVNEQEGAENIRNLNFVVAAPEGTVCQKGLAEESGAAIDLGTLQPHESRRLSIWVILIDAITPADPHPSLSRLRAQEWDLTYPAVSVDGVLAVGGGSVAATA